MSDLLCVCGDRKSRHEGAVGRLKGHLFTAATGRQCQFCGDIAVALAPQVQFSGSYPIVWLAVCQGHLSGWTDPSEPEYGATTFRAYYVSGENAVPESVVML